MTEEQCREFYRESGRIVHNHLERNKRDVYGMTVEWKVPSNPSINPHLKVTWVGKKKPYTAKDGETREQFAERVIYEIESDFCLMWGTY